MKQEVYNAKSALEKPQIGDLGENRVAGEDSGLPLELEAKNGDASLVSQAMAEEEEKMLEARVKQEGMKQDTTPDGLNSKLRFNKLDELLTQTQLYSEFLLEKMDNISYVITLVALFHVV